MYWNLNTDIECPKCGKKDTWNLQTHFMGEVMSCENFYALNEKVKELKGFTGEMNKDEDCFISDCPDCHEFFDYGATVVKGKVVKLYLLAEK